MLLHFFFSFIYLHTFFFSPGTTEHSDLICFVANSYLDILNLNRPQLFLINHLVPNKSRIPAPAQSASGDRLLHRDRSKFIGLHDYIHVMAAMVMSVEAVVIAVTSNVVLRDTPLVFASSVTVRV